MKEFAHPKFPTIHIKLLNNLKDASQIDTLLSDTHHSAIDLIHFAPKAASFDDKYLYGIFDADKLIGIIDLIEDYPAKDAAFIHAFYISDDYASGNLSETLYLALEKTVQETGITSFEIDDILTKSPLFNALGFETNKKGLTS